MGLPHDYGDGRPLGGAVYLAGVFSRIGHSSESSTPPRKMVSSPMGLRDVAFRVEIGGECAAGAASAPSISLQNVRRERTGHGR